MNESKYEDLLIGFAEVLKEKKSELFFKDLHLDRVKKQLEQAEERIKELEGNKEIKAEIM